MVGMDELEITGGTSGIDRRDFIKKSAIVGGMVWAAPMVSSIGSPAFAFTGNVIENCNKFFQAKFEVDDLRFDDCNLPDEVETNADCLPDGWDGEDRICVPSTFGGTTQTTVACSGTQTLSAEVVMVDGRKAVKFTLPPNCFTEGADAKAGGGDTLTCDESTTQLGGQELTVSLATKDVSFALLTFCCFCDDAA